MFKKLITSQTSLNDGVFNESAFAISISIYHRAFVAHHFGEQWSVSDCNNMCDICSKQQHWSRDDVTGYAKTVLQLVEKAGSAKEKTDIPETIRVMERSRKCLLPVESCECVIFEHVTGGSAQERLPFYTILYNKLAM